MGGGSVGSWETLAAGPSSAPESPAVDPALGAVLGAAAAVLVAVVVAGCCSSSSSSETPEPLAGEGFDEDSPFGDEFAKVSYSLHEVLQLQGPGPGVMWGVTKGWRWSGKKG